MPKVWDVGPVGSINRGTSGLLDMMAVSVFFCRNLGRGTCLAGVVSAT